MKLSNCIAASRAALIVLSLSSSITWAGNCPGNAVSSCSSMSASNCGGYINKGNESQKCSVNSGGVCSDGGGICNSCPGNGSGVGGDKCSTSDKGYCWSNDCQYDSESMAYHCTNAPTNCPVSS